MNSKLTGEGDEAVVQKKSLPTIESQGVTLDMLNNFCFHVYAQKSLFKVENVNAYFLTSSSS